MTDFNGKMITLARESRALTQSELAEKLRCEPSTLCKVEYGSLPAKDVFVSDLVSILNYPIHFFHQEFSIAPPNIHYRKHLSLPAKIVRKADAIMNIYRANIDKMLKSIEYISPAIPSVDEYKYDMPRKVAMFMRSYWKVPSGPINDLVALVERFGIMVIMLDYETDKIDGRSMTTESGHPIIFLNKHMAGERQRLTLAHELGHIIMHMKTIPTFARDEEAEAFEFASEFLMPGDEIKHQLPSKVTIEKLFDLKRIWKVSVAALIMSAEKLGRITNNQSRYLWMQYSKGGYRKSGEPIPISIDRPTIVERLIQIFSDGNKFSKSEMAQLFCLNESEYDEKYITPVQRMRIVI